MTKSKSRIPDRWSNYSSYGDVIDKFVALKVPLDSRFNVQPVDRFTPQQAIANLRLGLVIDLTNTARYYDPRDFTSEGVEYEKVNVQGRVVPAMSTVKRFIGIVNGYLSDGNAGGKLIGVHCTHGLNRTGYMVCAYLILEKGYHADDAIKMFNNKRGHLMERQNYLDSLRSLAARSTNWDRTVSQQPDIRNDTQHRNTPAERGFRRKDERDTRYQRDRHPDQHDKRNERSQRTECSWQQNGWNPRRESSTQQPRKAYIRSWRERDSQPQPEPSTSNKRDSCSEQTTGPDTSYEQGLGNQQWRSWRRQKVHPTGIGEWDPKLQRITRFPVGRYSGTPRRTVFS